MRKESLTLSSSLRMSASPIHHHPAWTTTYIANDTRTLSISTDPLRSNLPFLSPHLCLASLSAPSDCFVLVFPAMDPGYSHAYPSSHRRSQSKIAIPARPSSRHLSFSSLSSLQEPLLILVVSNIASAYATLGVDTWGLKNGLDPVVVVCGSFVLGAGWGWARGRARWDLAEKTVSRLLHGCS